MGRTGTGRDKTGLTRREIVESVRRLNREELIPVAEAAGVLGSPAGTVERWIQSGWRGVYLDGLHRPGVGWMTSREAVARFRVGRLWREVNPLAGLGRDALEGLVLGLLAALAALTGAVAGGATPEPDPPPAGAGAYPRLAAMRAAVARERGVA
jgi:hypothetical protein